MAKSSDNEKLWEQQKGESQQAFEAFSLYLEMGESRSLRAVGQRLGKSRAIIEKWSRRWSWQERLRSYNNEVQRQKVRKAKKDTQKMRKRQMETAVIMQQKALDALDKLNPAELHPKYIIQMFQVAAKIEQEIRQQNETENERTAAETSSSGDALLDALMEAYDKGVEGE